MASLAHFPPHVIEDAKRKAAELEDFQGMGGLRDHASIDVDDDDADGSRAKKRKGDLDAADRIIEETLKEWAEFRRGGTPTAEEEAKKLEEIRAKVAATNNDFLKPFLLKT